MPGRSSRSSRRTMADLSPDERLRALQIADALVARGMEEEHALDAALDKARRPIH